MKAVDFRTKDRIELNAELSKLLKANVGLHMQLVTQQLSNTSQFKKMRHSIARLKTVLGEKENKK